MKVLVFGATGGSGRAAVDALLVRGHDLTAFSRRPDALGVTSPRLRVFVGDVMRPADVERAVAGHDAVIVALGIHEHSLLVRLRGSKGTPLSVRSEGTAHVIAAMRKHGVDRLIVQTSYGVGETQGRLSFAWRLMFALILKPQIEDTEVQERIVRESGLDWTLVQPVALTDAQDDAAPFVSTDGDTRVMTVSRRSVGRFLAEAVDHPDYRGLSVALSAGPPA